MDGTIVQGADERRRLVVSNPLAVFFNLTIVIPVGGDADFTKSSLNQTLTSALISQSYSRTVAAALPALFSGAITVGGPIFFGGVVIDIPAVGPVQLAVNILSATFEHRTVPVYQNATSCSVLSYKDVVVLSVVLKVTNVGPTDYQVDAADLKKERCSTVVSYPAFYSLYVAGLFKTRAEKCISDFITPVVHTCSSQGISSGNYFVSTQWMDVSAATLTAGTAYPVTVSILTRNKLLTATSESFKVTYTASRRRALRSRRSAHDQESLF